MDALEIAVLILVILFAGAVIGRRVWVHVNKKRGGKAKSGCCDCAGCAASGSCPSAKKNAPTDDGMPEVTVLSTVACDFSDMVQGREGIE